MAKHNTPGFGIEYEILVPAYFALTLHQNENVKNYSIRTNVADFGNFDDVVVDIKMSDDSQHFFAIQLKHKENENTKLLPTNFEAKGDFNLEKYCKAFSNIDAKEQYNFILYTNREYNSCSKQTSKYFRVVQDCCPGETFFNSGSKSGSIYRFEVNDAFSGNDVTKRDYDKFFGRFRVYVGQKSFKGLKEDVFDILNKNERAMLSYLELFRTWHQKGYTNKTMDQTIVNLHLVDIFLSDFTGMRMQLSDEGNDITELFEMVVREYDITIINDSNENMVESCPENECIDVSEHTKQVLDVYKQEYKLDQDEMLDYMLYLGKKYKFLDRFYTKDKLATDTKMKKKILHYFFEKPLLVNFNESSAGVFYHTMKLYRKDRIKFVLIGHEIDATKLSKFEVFEKLDDLLKLESLHRQITEKCSLSLQGKGRITLEELTQSLSNVEFIRVKEILRMLTGDFVVGEDIEDLPVHYIPRRISTLVLKTESFLTKKFLLKNNVFIIEFDGKFEPLRSLFEKNDIAIVELPAVDTLSELPQKSTIIPIDNECPVDCFKRVLKKTKSRNLLHLKMVDFDTFIPLQLNNTDPAFFSEVDISESEIHRFCASSINFVCAEPGMGKSTLYRSLQKQLSTIWTVFVDLKAHNVFLKQKRPIDEVLQHFLKTSNDQFVNNIKHALLSTKNVVFFLDGLDELESTCIETVLDYSECLTGLGLRVWVSSRQHLKEKLISRFQKFVISLTEVDKNEQIQYIQNRLCRYHHDDIQQVTQKIFNSADLINNRQVLGVPLQLYIVTQIFLDDEDQFRSTAQNIFVLTKMYKLFFDGRYKHTMDKQEAKNAHLVMGDPEDHFERYEILALTSVLDDTVFRELNVDMRRTRRFLAEIQSKKDPLGIVVYVDNENKVVFEHQTYAEYFACVFLSYNFDKARVLRRHLFSDRYRGLLLILNIMLAEGNPLHLGVIYKDLQQIEKHIDDDNMYDRAGRTPLHLAASDCGNYIDLSLRDPLKFFQTSEFLRFVERVIKSRIIIKYVVHNDPVKLDELFNWTCLDYACQTHSIDALELILQKYQSREAVTIDDYLASPEVLFLYLVVTGCSNLFSTILAKRPHLLPKLILHVTIMFCFFNKMEMLTCLIQNGADLEYSYKGNTPLQLATRMKYFNVVSVLMEHGANVAVVTENGDTLLHHAVRNENFECDNYFPMDVQKELKDASGESYLCKCRNVDLVRYLLDKGVPVDARNDEDVTPLHLAALSGDCDVCELLCDNNADIDALTKRKMSVLHYAVMGDNLSVIAFVATKISDMDIQNDEGETPIFVAARLRHFEAAELVHSRGASAVISSRNVNLTEVLHREWLVYLLEAESKCDVELIKYAISTGMLGPTFVGKNGITLLHVAGKVDLDLTMFLVEEGVDVDCLTYDGVHVLQVAVYSGQVDIVRFLLGKANLERVVLDHKRYPLSFAVRCGRLRSDLLVQATVFINSLEDKHLYNVREKLTSNFRVTNERK